MYFIGNEEAQAATKTISTKLVNGSDYWKCLRFWYYIRVKRKTSSGSNFLHELEVYSVNSDYSRSKTVWSTPKATRRWTYVQLPLILDKDDIMVRSYKIIVLVLR